MMRHIFLYTTLNLALQPYDRLAAFTAFYVAATATSLLGLIALQHQLYRIDVAVASAQQSGAVNESLKAVYLPVRQRLRQQRIGCAVIAFPGPFVYLLAAVGAIPNFYAFFLVISPVELLVSVFTAFVFRPLKHTHTHSSAMSSAGGAEGTRALGGGSLTVITSEGTDASLSNAYKATA